MWEKHHSIYFGHSLLREKGFTQAIYCYITAQKNHLLDISPEPRKTRTYNFCATFHHYRLLDNVPAVSCFPVFQTARTFLFRSNLKQQQKEHLIFGMKREKNQFEMNDRFLEDLKNKTDIVELVRRYAELKKSGKNYMCRSPFRNERTPSFCVSPDKQFWYDFGVSEGGDAISFLEKIENVSFREAVEMLADMAGIEIPKEFGKEKGPSKEEKKDIFSLHETASEYFIKELQNSKKAQEYLSSRGITKEVLVDWKLGYGGDSENGLTKFLLEKGFSETDITRSGVAFEREFGDKKMKDRFSHRLIIPVMDSREGKIIAFTGRDLSGRKDTAKYINSPENPVYHKSSTLFGFDRARKIIPEKERVILVEGNFDVISAHSAGCIHTVATCGTSLTEDHLRLLKRLTKNILLAFDSDLAGKKATLRAVEMILKMEMNPFVIEITEGKDLDDWFKKDAEGAHKAIKNAENAVLFLLKKFADKYVDGKIEGEKKFLDAIFPFLYLIHRPIERDELLGQISKLLNRPRGVIEEEFQKFHFQSARKHVTEKSEVASKKFSREECFVGFLSANWNFFREKISEKILDILSDMPRTLLEKKLIGEELSEEEQKTLLSWELHEENLYGENISEEILERDVKIFISQLQNLEQKRQRKEFGRELAKKMKATED